MVVVVVVGAVHTAAVVAIHSRICLRARVAVADAVGERSGEAGMCLWLIVVASFC